MTKKLLAISLTVFLTLSALFFGSFVLAYHSGSDSNNTAEAEEEDEMEDEDEAGDEDVNDEEDEDENEDEDEDEIEDITEVELRDIPLRFGKFELGGTVTATDTTASTITVNGLAVNTSGARIHRGKDTALSSVLVGDRIRMSGMIENGTLVAERVAVERSGSSGNSNFLAALRKEIEDKIKAILEEIDELRKKLEPAESETQ
ncbi:MAG: hypothetical protein HYS89_02270 [Candidatus Colwellbacteria bacterium]|nr:hypothetical protein [Candidatus Colwellbacteria bacterium]